MNFRLGLMTSIVGVGLFVLSTASQAILHDRGGGLLYDDVLGVTWLQDANYAKTSGYDADGLMSWSKANAWVSALVYHDSIRNVDISGWRLPNVRPVDKAFNYEWRIDGSSDEGYNITSPNSELSFMYYVNLGLKGSFSKDGVYRKDFGVFGLPVAIWSGETSVGLVTHLQSNAYWSKSGDSIGDSWFFTTAEGNQRDGFPHPNNLYVWAVHSGDVAAVPEPLSASLFVAGLFLVAFRIRRFVGGKPA